MRASKLEFDRLQMYFGEPYVIDLEGTEGSITVNVPTIGDIVRFGEKRFYQTLNMFIVNTSTYKLLLWDLGIDWNEISDFDLFVMLYKQGIDKDACDLIFDGVDFSKFELFGKNISDEDGQHQIPILYDKENNIEIDENVYQHIHQYLQNVFNMFPEEKYTKDSMLKKWWVEKDRRETVRAEEKSAKGELKQSSIQSLISACINHPGFKYNLQQLKDVGVCQFYDSVSRLQIYESTTALMKGLYSGMINGKDIKPDEYNFMKEIN